MQIRPADKLTETSKDPLNTLAKLQIKILQKKNTMNLYA